MGRFALAVEFAGFITMGFVIGMYVDSTRGTRPWGMILGFLGGILLGTLSVQHAISEMKARFRGKRR